MEFARRVLLPVASPGPAAEQERVRTWLADHGGSAVVSLQFPRIERAGLRVATARTA